MEITTNRELVKIDILKDILNPQEFPWEYEDKSIDEIECIGVLEYIPGEKRGKFMEEIYRVLVDGGKATVAVPYWNSARAMQDYRYQWPPLGEQSFLYFNKGWREMENNKINGKSLQEITNLQCDFDFTYGYTAEPETAARSEESRSFVIKHYTNSIQALHLIMIKRPQV